MPFNPDSLRNLRQFSEKSGQQSGEDRTTVEQPKSVTVPEDQGVAVQIAAESLARGAPAAAELLNKIVSGAVRSPPHVRVQAAQTILDATGLRKQPQQPQEQRRGLTPEGMAMMARLAGALGVKMPTLPVTVDGRAAEQQQPKPEPAG